MERREDVHVRATQDIENDDGERVELSFGSPPAMGVTAGTHSQAVVTIRDDDDPQVTVSFGQSAYTVSEGSTVTVTVSLDADPERTVTIPITRSNQGTTTNGDYSGVPANVTFISGDTSETFLFAATDDSVDDDGESVLLGFGSLPTLVTEGGTATSTVSITDDDDPAVTVSFGAASYTAAEGGSVTVTVQLNADPERTVIIPIIRSNQGTTTNGDYSGVPANVAFAANERSKTFTFTAIQDTVDDDGESVLLGFGTSLPTGVSEGTIAETTVSITDDDDPQVTVMFGADAYTVAEGDTVTVTVTLSADPERTVVIPLTATNQGSATSVDYTVPSSVTFDADEMSKTITFTAADDSIDDDGESVLLGFGASLPSGVTAGTPATTTVSIADNDDPQVTVMFGQAAYTVAEGDTVTVTVTLSADPERTVEIPLTATNQGSATSVDYTVPSSVTFDADEMSKTITFTAADDSIDDDGESVLLGFGTSLPSGVSAGSIDETVVSITDDGKSTVFAEDANYRILTRYGSPTEIVLSDYLAEGVAGITFTLSSCDEWRGDYYISAAVEDGRLALESNALGHVHGENTQAETVCIVTGTGGGRNQDQEFRLYTVSDRTPLPLSPGALSLVEARLGEVDIRISAPQGAQEYLRLGWREIGGQPTFRVVSGVSDGTVLAIAGLEQGTEYEVRASLMTFQAFDLYRVGNSGAPLSLIPDGGPDSEWIGNLASGGLGKSQTITVTSAYRSSLSIEDVREREDVGGMTFEVTLSEASDDVVTVDWTTSNDTAETPADYQEEFGTLTFAAGETVQTLTVTIINDTVDEEEEETFTVTLSNAVNAGIEDASATGTITDDDLPAVRVSFDQSSYTVDEGDTVPVKVTLNEDPERTVTVPLTAANQDGASSADYSGVPASVTFNSGETVKEITFAAAQDTIDDDGESVKLAFGNLLPAGVSAGVTDETVVLITDDDIAGVTVHPTSVTIEEGDSAAYTVVLDSEPTGSVTVTVNAPANTDVTAEPASLTFTVDDWDTPQEVTVAVAQDGDAADDAATVTHSVSGADPAYSAVSVADVAVSVTDDDKSTVFAADASYRILTRYGSPTEIVLSDYLADGVTGITFTLNSCDEWRGDYYNSAIVEDERLVLESNTLGHIHGSNTQTETVCTVTGTGGGRNQDQEFRLYTVSDRTPLPLLPGALSLVEARPSEVDIRISAPQGAQNYLRLGWREIGGPLTFRVVSGVSDGTVLTVTGLEQGTEYEVRSSWMTFQAFDLYRVGNAGAPLSLIPDGGPDSEWIGNLASGGLGKSQTITVTSAYRSSLSIEDVREREDVGGMTFEVTLSEASDDVVTVDWTTSNDTAETPADYQEEFGTLTFAAGETVQTLTVTIINDTVDEEEEETFTVTLSNAVNAGIEDASATGTITDDDLPAVRVSFDQSSYTVDEGDTVPVKVTLNEDPERTVTVPLTAANQDGASSADYSGVPASVTFNSGETVKEITFAAAQDTIDDDGESVKLAFGNLLPAGVSAGVTDETVVLITDDDIAGVTVHPTSVTIEEGDSAAYTVVLDSEPTGSVTVTVNAPANTDVTAEPASLTFTVDDWDTPQEVTVAVAQDGDAADDAATVTHSVSGADPAYSAVSVADVAVSVTDDDKSTVFAADASYRILTRYGATTEIVLSDSLADGVTGITFTLSSCDEWRGDYYDSAVVEDERLVLASNTFGHIHGSNTQPETVCTITGTGGDRNQDQEFRFYTVSDRTPLSLLPGALSLVEARPSEVDIRISVPQGAQDYLRLGWREIGGQPTFRVVSGVSDGTVLTITGLKQGTEYDVRASLTTFQGFDLYRVGNSGAPLSLIPDGGPDSEWIGNLASGGLGKSQTITVTSAYRSSLSIEDVRERENVGGMVFEVTLSEASDDVVTVDWTTSSETAETPADYQAESGTLTFPAGETVQTLTVTINNDAVDEEEEETFTVTLTNAVNAGIEDASATGTITDDDVPSVSVSFEQADYTVVEGSTETVTVTLNADPERTVIIPITNTDQDGASSSDYSGVPASITFNAGDTEVDITFSATQDQDNDDGESVKLTFGNTLPAGVSAGSIDETVVSITDDDVPSVEVSFEQRTYTVAEGSTETVTVTLNADPERTVIIPITTTDQDGASSSDYSGVPASITFNAGDAEVDINFSATQDQDNDDGESVKLTFGNTLPTGVSAGTTNETTMMITDDDLPSSLTVAFGSPSYSVTEGDDVEVTVTLSEDPERSVTVPLTATNQGGASDSDYSGVPPTLTFNSGETGKSFTVEAAEDNLEDDGESVKLGFGTTLPTGVSAATNDEATVSITNVSAQNSLTINFGASEYALTEGGTARVAVTLSTAPGSDVTIPLTATNQGGATSADYSGVPTSLTFGGSDTLKTFPFTATQDQDNDDGESVKLTFGNTLPAGVSAGSIDETVVSITDDGKSTVFAEDANYRILTRYGSPTEIVLSDYLAEGVAGITFTLSSCDEWRGDYYISAAVEDGRLALESNALGHVHGENTQAETVCIVTGTGGGRNQDQEFRLYTVSDRTPLPLSPGALSLVEARLGEVDIRISAPQGAQEYLRLGWREIGGQPTFRVVSGVSDGTVLAIAGLEQGTEYEVRASLMTFQAFDLYRVGNSGAPLSLIPDGGPDSEWIGNLASGGLGKSQTITVTSAYRSSLSIEDVREREDVGGMTFEVTLSEASDDVVTVDWTTSNDTAETPADYQEEFGTLTFAAGETVQTLTVTIINDTVDEEEEETFTVTLSNAVNAGIEDASATGTITDDDLPAVRVSFDQSSYTVDEGDTVPVTVTLNADPERTVIIPITNTDQDGASSSDYSGVPASITFNAGDTEVDINFSATQDQDNDDGESVLLGFGASLPSGVTAGTPATTTVSIADNDDPQVTVMFGQAAYTVAEGDTLTVTVTLSADPERTVEIPLTATNQGSATSVDYTVPSSVTFDADEMSKTITFTAADDSIDDDAESVLLGFGTSLPSGVTAGTPATTTVSITDNDDPQVTVMFGADAYTVAEGDTVTVTVTLSADPERTVEIPLTATNQGSATSVDYTVPSSVTFDADEMSKTITFTAADDSIDDDAESVLLGFGTSLPSGVTAGTPATTTVSIADNDDPQVTVMFGQAAYTVAEGDTVTVTVTLSADPERTVVIPLTATNQGSATSVDYTVPSSVTFDADEMSKTITFTAADDSIDDDGESVLLAFGTSLPSGVTAGTPATTTVSIADNDDPQVTVMFGQAAYTVAEGDTVTVTVTLSADPERTVEIPLTATNQGSATSVDYTVPSRRRTRAAQPQWTERRRG